MKTSGVSRGSGRAGLWLLVAGLCLSACAAWAEVNGVTPESLVRSLVAEPTVRQLTGLTPLTPAVQRALVWHGADIDGDGQEDFTNPTGKAVRATDAFGCGEFGAPRDGDERRHEGVDYISTVGQVVKAPISGFVTRIGYAYADDRFLRFVEINNPALHYTSRVFYVLPSVAEGQAVRLGQPVGWAMSLQRRYPGITNHVHLEIERRGRAPMDATRLIVARYELRAAPAETSARAG